MKKEKYALLDTDFISKTHLIRKDEQNKMIDRIMEMQGYRFYCHEQIKIELTRHNIGSSPEWLRSIEKGIFRGKFYTSAGAGLSDNIEGIFFAGTEGRLR